MRQISPEAVGLEIDVSDAPRTWNVYTVNKDGDLVDLFDELHDSVHRRENAKEGSEEYEAAVEALGQLRAQYPEASHLMSEHNANMGEQWD
jgi:hypothetical protein